MVMTSDPVFTLAVAVPTFAALVRQTIQLHPRSVEENTEVVVDASEIGGIFHLAWKRTMVSLHPALSCK